MPGSLSHVRRKQLLFGAPLTMPLICSPPRFPSGLPRLAVVESSIVDLAVIEILAGCDRPSGSGFRHAALSLSGTLWFLGGARVAPSTGAE
jgi:hypothetical protein